MNTTKMVTTLVAVGHIDQFRTLLKEIENMADGGFYGRFVRESFKAFLEFGEDGVVEETTYRRIGRVEGEDDSFTLTISVEADGRTTITTKCRGVVDFANWLNGPIVRCIPDRELIVEHISSIDRMEEVSKF